MEKFKAQQDADGNESSKRVIGMRLVNISIWWALIDYSLRIGMSIFGTEIKFQFPYEIWLLLLTTGCGLLGITLVEWFAKSRTTNK